MIFKFGKYVIDVDVEQTRALYNRANKITDICNCSGCRNFEQWSTSTSSESKSILKQMGIQLEKAAEVYVNYRNKDKSVFYSGFYPLCGRIIQDDKSSETMSKKNKKLSEMSFVEVCDDFRIAFTEKNIFLIKDFTASVITMEIMANIPWVLEERCVYLKENYM